MAKKGAPLKRKHSSFVEKKSDFPTGSIPWVEEFTPSTIEELVVHKKKVSEVQACVQRFFFPAGKQKVSPILLLTGPPGAGKTATVKVLCKSLGAELYIWSNTSQENTWKSAEELTLMPREEHPVYESQSSAFSRFLLHSVKYSLFYCKRVVLVEEFPNSFRRNPSEFHNILRRFTACGQIFAIFIVSENAKGESEENLLFPKDLQSSLSITNISFNPVAPTMLMKVMIRINVSSKVHDNYVKLNKSQLESIAADSKGDIRNAINTMQFLCVTQSGRSISTAEKKASDSSEANKTTSKKDTSLFLFHALGKILYCKREPALKSEPNVVPTILKHLERDPLLVNPEEVFEKTSISPNAYSLFLQENYLSFIENISIASECSRWLSEADTLSSFWSGREVMNEYAVSLASRGIMFNLVPCNSSRRWKALHKPQFYENNKKRNKLQNSLKRTYKGTSLSMRELQIDFVPYVSKVQSKSLNIAQINLAKELGEMNVKRITRLNSKVLDEKDCFEGEMDDLDADPAVDSISTDTNEEVPIEDEEIVIEDYDF